VPDVLYRCYCLLEMPPVTADEQRQCMTAREGCWRFQAAVKKAATASA